VTFRLIRNLGNSNDSILTSIRRPLLFDPQCPRATAKAAGLATQKRKTDTHLDKASVSLNTIPMGATPHAILRLLEELEANRRSRRSARATLQRLRKFMEANGTRIATPKERTFESDGEVIESGLRRTVEGRDVVMRSLIQAVYRFRDAALIAEKKADFGAALQNLHRELGRAEDLVGPS
jgi:hypothetical protein